MRQDDEAGECGVGSAVEDVAHGVGVNVGCGGDGRDGDSFVAGCVADLLGKAVLAQCCVVELFFERCLRLVGPDRGGDTEAALFGWGQPKGCASEMVRRALKKNAPAQFNATRLRNTWLCRHLEAGTDLKSLMAAAGVHEATHLHNLLVWIPDAEPVTVARSLRFNTHAQIRDAHETLLRLADEQTTPGETLGHGYPMRGVRE